MAIPFGFFIAKDLLAYKAFQDRERQVWLQYKNRECESVQYEKYWDGYKSPDDCFYSNAVRTKDGTNCDKIKDNRVKQEC